MKEWLAGLQGRWQQTLERYGKAALGTYVAIFVTSIVGFWVAIRWGVDVGTSVAELGTLGAAYAATKLLQPLRIAATLVITPFVAQVIGGRGPSEGEA